jgi:hypothetical protein
MISWLPGTITHALMITGFVFIMMVMIEYLNIMSRGIWQQGLRGSRWRQYLLASFLGATPGCLGAFTVVSLYLHREVSLGALVVAMVATSGDESFVMLSLIPKQAPLVFLMLFCIGIAAGFVTDAFFAGKKVEERVGCHDEFDVHDKDICHCFPLGRLREQWVHCSSARGILGVTLLGVAFCHSHRSTGACDLELDKNNLGARHRGRAFHCCNGSRSFSGRTLMEPCGEKACAKSFPLDVLCTALNARTG